MAYIIPIIGAGGKTTALGCLAQALADRRVLLTTTTHIYPIAPPWSHALLIDPDEQVLSQALASPGIVCAGTSTADGKLGALAPDLFQLAAQQAEIILCEADGAHGLPLKLHRPDEPVVPSGSALCLIVAGLSAWGRPVCESVHRYGRNPSWARSPRQLVNADEILYCVRETAASCRLPREQLRVWLNQADTLALRAYAAPLAHRLIAEGLDCRAGSLRRTPQSLTRWCLSGL